MVLKKLLKKLEKLTKPKIVLAHCDIPCGVYETDTMFHALKTVESLNNKLLELETPDDDESEAVRKYTNTATRMITVKEEYVQIIKKEVLILWTDYFNQEHLKKHRGLHDLIWKTVKNCSVVKREISKKSVMELEDCVKKVIKIFKETKK